MPSNGTCTTWINPNIVELDFDCYQRNGQWRGGPVAFYIMTPEQLTGGDTPNCPPVDSTLNRIYSTDNSVNDDGDYVHFLIYRSRTFTNGYYLGWEDLFRGGDNDFEDALVRAIGLIPTCVPAPEVCDGLDNNCNGMVDEGLGQLTCGLGACRRTVEACVGGRTQVCTPGNASAEICDNLDNNCNGMIDDNAAQDWVSIGGGRQVMKYEASHPDATAVVGGTITTLACSKAVCFSLIPSPRSKGIFSSTKNSPPAPVRLSGDLT